MMSQELASRSTLQWARKIFHLFNGTCGLVLYLYSGLPKKVVIGILAATVTINLSLDLLRIAIPTFNKKFTSLFKGLMRETERHTITSATKGLGATLIVLLIFPEQIGILVMLFVTYCDTAGAIAGTLIKSPKLNTHASVAGSLSVWILGSLLTAIAVNHVLIFATPVSGATLMFISIGCGFIAALSEAILPQYDDNLTLPLVSAPLLYGFFTSLELMG